MQKILWHRIPRDLRKGAFRYAALSLLVILSVYMVISLICSAESIIRGVHMHAEENLVEDGQFETFVELTEEEQAQIRENGVTLEAQFYLDFPAQVTAQAAGEQQGEKDTEAPAGDLMRLRVFRVRREADLAEFVHGAEPVQKGEIALERRFAEVNGLVTGSRISVGGTAFTVTGICTTPDYDNPVENMADSSVDSRHFGTAFVTDEQYAELKASGGALRAETFLYAFRLPEEGMDLHGLRALLESFPFEADAVKDPYFQAYRKEQLGDARVLRDLLESPLFSGERYDDMRSRLEPDIHNLQSFVSAEDNIRIGGSAADMYVNLYSSLVAGVIIIALFAYVLAVFTLHQIDDASAVIGALYSLGVTRRDLTIHYAILPTLITAASGIVGTIAGFAPFGAHYQMMDSYNYYSVPEIAPMVLPYIVVYGAVLPPLIAAAVNVLVVRKHLSRTALSLLRRERKTRRLKALRMRRLGFIGRFRVRQMLRETRGVLTVLAGLYITLMLVFIGLDCDVMCRHLRQSSREDTRFSYMYLYKYPEQKVPEGGEAAYALSLHKERFGYDLDVTLLGIDPETRYFDAHVRTDHNAQRVVSVSSAMAQKYGLSVGGEVTLVDEENNRLYAFEIGEIVQYAPAFYVFMDIDAMRDLLGAEEDYYNVVFSDQPLDIDPGRLFSTVSYSSITRAGDIFIELMQSMIVTMVVLSAFIFVVVLYLMLGVMIDHSAYDISMMKIFGYRGGEIRKLYVNGNILMVAAGTLLIIPLAKKSIDALYPLFISNVACAMDLSMPWWYFALIYAVILALCLVITLLMNRRIGKVSPAEVLKDRE